MSRIQTTRRALAKLEPQDHARLVALHKVLGPTRLLVFLGTGNHTLANLLSEGLTTPETIARLTARLRCETTVYEEHPNQDWTDFTEAAS